MTPEDRLARLRALVGRLERLPASAQSEWMLREARARVVDIETGEGARAMRPLAEDPPPPARAPAPARRPRVVPRPAPPQAKKPVDPVSVLPDADAPKAADFATTEESAAPLGTEDLLSLGEELLEEAPGNGDAGSHPWRRGLRG